MQVDTDVFAALTERAEAVGQLAEQVGALGRKVSALTGRVTFMGTALRGLAGGVETLIRAAEFGAMLRRARAPEERHVGRRAARSRHGLRAIDGGQR